jgi:hypothetical protein
VVTFLVFLLSAQHPGRGKVAIYVAIYIALWLVFAAGAWLVLRTAPRRAVPLILLGAVAVQLAALSGPPRTSTDLYRYIWDGRVQAAGIDPYRYVPAAPQLTRLRDPFLWPAHGPTCIAADGVSSGPSAGPEAAKADVRAPALTPGCTLINRPGVHTIYPPVAEAYFTAVGELSPPGSGSLPIQAAAAALAIAITVLLLAGLRRFGRDPRLAVLWAWCPPTALEAGNNAHVDVLATFLTVAALLTFARDGGRHRAARGAVLLGLAIATKITPVLAVPAVLRRRPATVALAGAAATGIVYLPHVLAVGGRVIGFLPGYLGEEGYGTGSRFQLLSILVPGRWAILAGVMVLAAVAVIVMRRADPERPWSGALIMTGAGLAVTTPPFSWYAMLLVALVALDGRAEWLAIAAAGYGPDRAGYATALAFVAAVSLIRSLARRREARCLSPAGPPTCYRSCNGMSSGPGLIRTNNPPHEGNTDGRLGPALRRPDRVVCQLHSQAVAAAQPHPGPDRCQCPDHAQAGRTRGDDPRRRP